MDAHFYAIIVPTRQYKSQSIQWKIASLQGYWLPLLPAQGYRQVRKPVMSRQPTDITPNADDEMMIVTAPLSHWPLPDAISGTTRLLSTRINVC